MAPHAVVPVEVRVYTNEFRVYGLLHMRPGTSTAWHMNMEERPHLPLSQVSMYRSGIQHPANPADLVYASHFAAIPKSSIRWIQGGEPDDAKAGLGLEPREVYLVFPANILSGWLLMRPEVRLSDHLGVVMSKRSWVCLRRVRLLGHGAAGTHLAELPAIQEHGFITVDTRQVSAVFDARGGDPVLAYSPEA